nr:transposase [Granulicella sp. L60]
MRLYISFSFVTDPAFVKIETVGRTSADTRVFINGVLWVLRSGAHWHDLPERYGKYKSVHKRSSRWAASGV